MATGARIRMTTGTLRMTTSTDILTLTQWFSPAYPVGAFAYSHGLEWAIEAGDVCDVDGLRGWITDVLQHGSGYADALFLAAAYQAEDVGGVDADCRAFCASAERLKETTLQGAAFCEITAHVFGSDVSALCYPVAVGHTAQVLGLPPVLAAQMYLQAFVGNLVSVGVRLVPLGQTAGQSLLRELTPLCISIAEETKTGELSQLSSSAFLADIAAMKHETQYSRVFRT